MCRASPPARLRSPSSREPPCCTSKTSNRSSASTSRRLFARYGEESAIVAHQLEPLGRTPEVAYQLIHDELMLDGNARQNLATFVSTFMDAHADRLFSETYDKNMIDKDEYPQTAQMEARCVSIIANLWNSPDGDKAVGTSTIGSSEAVMLAGLSLKRLWQHKQKAAGKSIETAQPGDGPERAGGVGEVLPLLGRRAALRTAGRGQAAPDRGGSGQARRREHDRRGGDPRFDLRRLLRAGQGDRRGPRRLCRRRRAGTSPCTSTAPPGASWPRSSTRIWNGTSGSRGCIRSTRPGTSTAWSTPASGGSCGAPRTASRTTSSST